MTQTETQPEELAREFSRMVRRNLSEHLDEIARRNATPEYAGACATHDFCDPNELMIEAFEAVVGREIDFASDEDAALMNTAWSAAKARGFRE